MATDQWVRGDMFDHKFDMTGIDFSQPGTVEANYIVLDQLRSNLEELETQVRHLEGMSLRQKSMESLVSKKTEINRKDFERYLQKLRSLFETALKDETLKTQAIKIIDKLETLHNKDVRRLKGTEEPDLSNQLDVFFDALKSKFNPEAVRFFVLLIRGAVDVQIVEERNSRTGSFPNSVAESIPVRNLQSPNEGYTFDEKQEWVLQKFRDPARHRNMESTLNRILMLADTYLSDQDYKTSIHEYVEAWRKVLIEGEQAGFVRDVILELGGRPRETRESILATLKNQLPPKLFQMIEEEMAGMQINQEDFKHMIELKTKAFNSKFK